MRKLYVVKNARDFEKIIKTGKLAKNKSFIIYYSDNDLPYNRYGISVGIPTIEIEKETSRSS